MLFSKSFFIWPDEPDYSSDEPYSVKRFLFDWLVRSMIPIGLAAYTTTKSITISIISSLLFPLYGVSQGTYGMLNYRYHFGTPPYPKNPAHGVVVVNPVDLKETIKNKKKKKETTDNNKNETETNNTKIGEKEKKVLPEDDDYDASIEIEYGTYDTASKCEGGMRWRRGGPLSEAEQEVLDSALNDKEPIRMLVIGDSLALGLGTDRSCMPLMPETLAKSISKHSGGRAVFWTSYGAEGAASSWTLKELSKKARKQKEKEKELLKNNKKNNTPLPAVMEVNSDSSSSDGSTSSDETTTTETTPTKNEIKSKQEKKKNATKNNFNEDVDMFGEWKERLRSFGESFDDDINGPYDYVFIFAGGNDAKSAVIPFYVRTKKDDTTVFHDGRTESLFTNFERILEYLGPKMYNTNFITQTKEHDNDNNNNNKENNNKKKISTTKIYEEEDDTILTKNKKTPLVVFPFMPPRIIPCFQLYPLLWMAVPLTGIIENNKRRLQKKYSKSVVTVPPPTTQDVSSFEKRQGTIWNKRIQEDTLLCLRDITNNECTQIVHAMTEHVRTKSKIYRKGMYASRNVPSVKTMTNVPKPALSKLPGRPGHNIFSVDHVHPNDEGYDFWGRFIAHGLFQQLLDNNNNNNSKE